MEDITPTSPIVVQPPESKIEKAVFHYGLVTQFINRVLRDGIDYGKIPGCGDKPVLLLPGAQKIAALFRFGTKLHLDKEIEDWTGIDHKGEPFFMYRHRCEVFDSHSNMISAGYGSANSWEKKYRWRESKRRCPRCESEAIRKSSRPGEGFYCWGKIGGCGAKFGENDSAITGQRVGLEPNPEIFDQTNTILKISAKRAYVTAILYAAGISEFFTVDLDDLASATQPTNLSKF